MLTSEDGVPRGAVQWHKKTGVTRPAPVDGWAVSDNSADEDPMMRHYAGFAISLKLSKNKRVQVVLTKADLYGALDDIHDMEFAASTGPDDTSKNSL